MGQAGYIYQASNFLYGGFIWTDVYVTKEGKRLHPLQLQAERHLQGLDTNSRTKRPKPSEMVKMGWQHYFGKQFRYVKFLCNADEQHRLLVESQFAWNTEYPKNTDLEWKRSIGGKRIVCDQPHFSGTSCYASHASALPPV